MNFNSVYKFLLYTCLFLSFHSLQGGEDVLQITMQGHISQENTTKAITKINQSKSDQLILIVNSSSGELIPALSLAKTIYAARAEKGTQVTVYINEQAVGPAAIFPFLANELYTSHFVSWGDIPLGTEDSLPTNILKNRVTSLIDLNNPKADLLKVIASAMTDEDLLIIEGDRWSLSREEDAQGKSLISSYGETLVVNHNQLKTLGLVKAILPLSRFKQQFSKGETVESSEEARNIHESPIAITPKELENRLKEHITFTEAGPNRIGYIKIDDRTSGISQATWLHVKKALEYYKEIKPVFIILELNTPGGQVFASQKISDALKEIDTQLDIPVIAFVNNWAISAGAMLAYSCRFISVVKDASMGAAEPVLSGQSGEMKTASEKVNSALRADFANRARFFDRNPDIAEAMVDKDITLVLRHGRIVKLGSDEQIKASGPNPDVVITTKGKLLTLSTEQLMKYGVADLLLAPAKTGFITELERDKGRWPAEKELLFSQSFFKGIPNAEVYSYKMDWKTRFFVLLTTPMVSSLLFLGMMLGFYTEINTPGFGVPGTIGLTCLVLIAMANLALDIANVLEILLLCVGIAMLLVEIFVLPSFGLLGIIGILFLIAGLVGMMLPGLGTIDFELDTQTFNAAGEAAMQRLGWLAGTFLVGLVLIALLARYVMPSFSAFQRFVLSGHEQSADEGYIAVEDPASLPSVGTKGEAATELKPAGKILINGEYYEAMSDSAFIVKGTPVVVARLDGSIIFVAEETQS